MSSPSESPSPAEAVQRLRTLVDPADGPVDTLFLSAARIADLRALLDAATTGRLSGWVPNTETVGDTTFLSSQETKRRVLVYESRKLGRMLFDVSTAGLKAKAYMALFHAFDAAGYYEDLSGPEIQALAGHPEGCMCGVCHAARIDAKEVQARKELAELADRARLGDHAAVRELLDARNRAHVEYETFDFDELRRCLPDAGRTL